MVRLTLNQTTHEEWLAQNSVLSSSSITSTPRSQVDVDDTAFFSCDEESVHELVSGPTRKPELPNDPSSSSHDEENDKSTLPADVSDDLSAEEPRTPFTPRALPMSDDEDSEDDVIFGGSRRTPFVLGTRTTSQKIPEIPIAVDEDSDDNESEAVLENNSEDSDGSEFMPSPPPQKAKTPRTPFSISSPTKLNRTSSKPVPAFLRRLQGIQKELPDNQVLEEIQPSPRKQRPRISLKRDPSLAVASSLPSLSNDEIGTLSREMGDLAVDEDHVLEHTPNRFKRPPKIVQRTSSKIFDLSDSESESEIEELSIPSSNKASSAPRPKTAATPRTTSKSGKPLAPKTVERLRKKEFEQKKDKIAKDYLKLLDDTVNNGAVERLTAATGGIQLVWTNSKQSTAGTCQTIRYSAGLGEDNPSAYFSCVITLESKVCDDVERVESTLAHEYTHACVDILEIDRRQLKNEGPHGRLFKTWAKKVGRAMNIETPETCHSYEINYKFEYQCTICDRIYKAHSRKPAWTTSKGCELCKVPLVQIKPVPRTAKGTTPYQAFQKETFAKLKQDLPPGTPFSLVKMQKEVNRLWKEEKSRNEPGTADAGSPLKGFGENETILARFEKLVITIDD
ncbi:uncharacterized protein DFL_008649 [Arthrobotrys flagrans]|uniref:SprT-like domain-containing protein n=1 Tax=Arthrobotrys flagrans TaxID=97331 RepID=A0A436ZPC6_ARTFL|nr:hypothetical protein DFL_008649 [Arthrobotrys flagrans]